MLYHLESNHLYNGELQGNLQGSLCLTRVYTWTCSSAENLPYLGSSGLVMQQPKSHTLRPFFTFGPLNSSVKAQKENQTTLAVVVTETSR